MASTYMKSTFDGSRALPEAIALRDEHIVFGPFCAHCGAPQGEHSPEGHCPRSVSVLYPMPICGCHGPGKRPTQVPRSRGRRR